MRDRIYIFERVQRVEVVATCEQEARHKLDQDFVSEEYELIDIKDLE